MSGLNNNIEVIIYADTDPAGNPGFAGQEWINETNGHKWHGTPTSDGGLEWTASTSVVQDGSITEPKLAANSVSTPKVRDGAITDPKLSNAVRAEIAASMTAAAAAARAATAAQTIADGKLSPIDLSSIAEGTVDLVENIAATQTGRISFRDKLIGFGKIDFSAAQHETRDSQPVPKHLEIELQNIVARGIYVLDIIKTQVKDPVRIHLPGAPLTSVTFADVGADQVAELTNAVGLVRVAILISTLPDGSNSGVASGLILTKEFTNEKVLQILNELPSVPSLNPLDKFLAILPVEEGRPSHSNLETFSNDSTEPIVIDQTGDPPDLIERTYDDRSGSTSPNQSIWCLITDQVENFYSPAFQLERDDAEALGDFPTDSPRRGLVVTDSRGRNLQAALVISLEGKISLIMRHNEFTATLHFGTNRRIDATYRNPPTGVGRVPLGFLKLRGGDYEETGSYTWDLLSPDLPTFFPSLASRSPQGVRLKITGLQTLVPGGTGYTGHLNLFISDVSFTQTVIGQEIAALPYQGLSNKMDEKIDSKTQALGNDLEGKIRNLQEQIDELEESGGGSPTDFSMTIIGSSLNLTNAESLPAVNAEFDIIFYAQGVNNAPSGNFTALIDGSPIEITEQPTTLMERVNVLTARINNDATRANLIRQAARNDRLDVQILKGTERSNILHIPLHDEVARDRYAAIPVFRGNIASGATVTMASFTGLTVGKQYVVTIDIAVSGHNNNDRLRILLSRTSRNPEDNANQIYREDYGRITNSSEQTFTFDFIADATTLVVSGIRTAAGDANLGVVSNGIVVEYAIAPERVAGTDFSA